MGGMKISELDFARLLPAFMRDDQAVKALCMAVNDLLGEPGKRLATIRTWDMIDALTDAECDELAWELDIDWYDSVGMTLTEKRETIKDAQKIKRKRGTKWAIDRLIAIYIGEGYISEWYEIDGEPYTFAIMSPETNVESANFDRFMELAKISKNERSHLAGIFFDWSITDTAVECSPVPEICRYNLEKCGTRYRAATVGAALNRSVETEPETTLHRYSFPECGATGDKATLGAAIVGTAIAGRAIARS